MGKHKDLILLLFIILIGMFIPFVGAITINYGFDLWMISGTFGYFLLIFAVELGLVFGYFWLNSKVNADKFEKLKPEAFQSSKKQVKQKAKK